MVSVLDLNLTDTDGREGEDRGGAEEDVREDPGETEPGGARPVADHVLAEGARHDQQGDQQVRHGEGQEEEVGRLAESGVTQHGDHHLHTGQSVRLITEGDSPGGCPGLT